jgi:two-component system cell cycle sensor histidine kinase/response regulator CckA
MMGEEPLRVLLVDDDEDDYIITQDLLSDLDHTTNGKQITPFILDWVSDYESGLKAIAKAQHDVYLIDYRLGEYNGLELVKQAIKSGCLAPLILLTGQGDREIDLQAMEAGAADYLVKNQIDAPLLERAIRYAVEQKRAEVALRKSEAKNRAILNALPDLMLRIGEDGTILEFMSGKKFNHTDSLHRIVGKKLSEVLPEEITEQSLWHIQQILVHQVMQVFRFQVDLEDEVRDLEARGVPNGPGEVLTVVRDITERKRLEAQLLQSQKMEAVGRLAGGIAHDFNNLLTAILNYTNLAMRTIPDDSMAKNDLEDIKKITQHAADLVRQLLAFARPQMTEDQILNLNDLIKNMHKVVIGLIGSEIEFVQTLAPDLGDVKSDSSQLGQVLINVIINAKDAMPQGGRLHIETANVQFSQNLIHQHSTIEAGDYVLLSITDNGLGMTEEVQAQIFEPFFTTKEVGKGTGLGLATCFGIISRSQGHILVESQVNEGTTLKIYLPRI